MVEGLHQSGTKLDWDRVTRQVLSSEPPRAQDISAQVAWCKVWGGGKKQTFATDALNYIQRKGSDNIVTGQYFDKMAMLNLPPHNMCPYFVSAVLKCTATRGSNDKGFANHVLPKDIGQIAGVKMEACVEANAMMKRAVDLVHAVSDPDRKTLLTIARGDMECDMVDFVFEKGKTNNATLKTIVEHFIQATLGLTVVKPTSTSPQCTRDGDADANIFDPSANVAQQSFANQGVRVGCLMCKKGNNESQFEVAYINDDGSVSMIPIDTHGKRKEESVIVQLSGICAYSIIGVQMKLSIASPDRLPSMGDKLPEAYLKGACAMALHSAYWRANVGGATIQLTPCVRVRTNEAMAVDEFKLVPWGVVGKACDADKDGVPVVHALNPKGERMASFEIVRPNDLGKKDGVEVPFWRMQHKTNDTANMTMSHIDVPIAGPTVGSLSGALTCQVPCAVLKMDVGAGTELTLAVYKKRKDTIITTVTQCKKAKGSKA